MTTTATFNRLLLWLLVLDAVVFVAWVVMAYVSFTQTPAGNLETVGDAAIKTSFYLAFLFHMWSAFVAFETYYQKSVVHWDSIVKQIVIVPAEVLLLLEAFRTIPEYTGVGFGVSVNSNLQMLQAISVIFLVMSCLTFLLLIWKALTNRRTKRQLKKDGRLLFDDDDYDENQK